MRLLLLLSFVAANVVAQAQTNLRVWFDSANSKHTYHTLETLSLRIKVQNLSNEKICFILKTELVTSDGRLAEVHSGIFNAVYSHGGPDPNDYVWKEGEFKSTKVDCSGNDSRIYGYVRPNHTYIQLETLQENILVTSGKGRYKFNLPTGTYYFKVELTSNTGEYVTVDYPIQITEAPLSIQNGLLAVFQTCDYHPNSFDESIVSSLNIYRFLDTCPNPLYRDKAFILMAPFASPVKTQQDVDRLISYFPRITNNDVVLNMAYKLIARLRVCDFKYLEGINKYQSYKSIIHYFLKREREMADAFFAEVYASEKRNQRTIYRSRSCLSGQSSLLTEQQLSELEALLDK